MMALFLGDFAHAIHKREGGLKVGEFVSTHEVMLIDDLPMLEPERSCAWLGRATPVPTRARTRTECLHP